MPPTVTFSPENPRPALDAINIYVTGEVAQPARVVIFNDDDKLVGQSPAFGQDAPYRNAQYQVSLTGNPDGGTWTLTVDGDTTAAIPWNATAAQIESAIGAAVGNRKVRVAGDAPGPITVEFQGELGDREVPLTAADSLTGGTSPGVDIDEVYPGGKDTDGITSLIMPSIVLPEGTYALDLVYAGGDDDGESLLGSQVALEVAEE